MAENSYLMTGHDKMVIGSLVTYREPWGDFRGRQGRWSGAEKAM